MSFQNILQGGRASTLIELWQPWWTRDLSPIASIEEVDAPEVDFDNDDTEAEEMPEILPDIVAFEKLYSKNPSPLLPFNLINILYAYAFMMRLYNGEVSDDILQALDVGYSVCTVLFPASFSHRSHLSRFSLKRKRS